MLSAIGMALFPWSARFGIVGIIAAIVLLYTGINVQRSPFQALRGRRGAVALPLARDRIGDVPDVRRRDRLPHARSRARHARRVPHRRASRCSRIAAALRVGLVEPSPHGTSASEATFRSLFDALGTRSAASVPGMRAIFVAALLLQLTFQTFTTWFALHGTERFGVQPEDVTIGFIAWAMGGVIGALPAGWVGVQVRPTQRDAARLLRSWRRRLVALDRVTSMTQAAPLLALASAAWTFPTVNAYPMFVEPIPRERRGVLAALFLLCMALGGGIGDPMNGALFDLFGSYRPLFLMMAVYTALAFVAVLAIPRGAGEAVG